jgi:hypothetical protein
MMPGLFDGTDEIVRLAFIDHGVRAKGISFTSGDHYIQFSRLVQDDRAEAQSVIWDIMRKTYHYLRNKIDDAQIREQSSCGGRGV